MHNYEEHYNDARTLFEKRLIDSVCATYNHAKVICKSLILNLHKMRFDNFLWTLVIFICLMALINVHRLREHRKQVVYERGKLNFKCLLGNVTDRIKTPYPVIVWWTYGSRVHSESIICPNNKICHIYSYQDRLKPVDVGAYLFYASGIKYNRLPLPRQPNKIIWAMSHEESPRNAPELCHEEGLKLFNFSATFSRHSDVPFPLQFIVSLESITDKHYFIETSMKNMLLKEISPIIYLQSDCSTHTERDEFVTELMKYVPIDSYGPCVNNKEIPKNLKRDHLNSLYADKTLKFIARYKFVIAIENAVCDDYVTEKFWRPIHVGVVPIYYGSPKIRDWLPNKNSAILVEDFSSPKLLSGHIQTLIHNDSMYEEYLEHKTKGTISNKRLSYEVRVRPYQTNYINISDKLECVICEKLHDYKSTRCEVNIVDKTHYNCPKPTSVLTFKVNPSNQWADLFDRSKYSAIEILATVMNETTCRTGI